MGRRTTITQIAEGLELSSSTISRVVNGDKGVAAATRSRVLAEMERLGYTPDPFAQGLKTGKTKTIQLVVGEVDSNFIPTIMLGIEKEAYRNGYRVLLSSLDYERSTVAKDHLAAGVIYAGDPVAAVDIRTVIPDPDTPVVCVYGYDTDNNCRSIIPDDEDGALQATRHLISIGRRKIVHIRGEAGWVATNRRTAGYERAMIEAGLGHEIRILGGRSYDPDTGCRGIKELIRENIEFDAVFAGADLIAVGVYRAAQEFGLEIPRDIAVAGFDDKEFAQIIRPSLTTIRMPLQEMGRTACLTLLDQLSEGWHPEGQAAPTLFRCELQVRESAM